MRQYSARDGAWGLTVLSVWLLLAPALGAETAATPPAAAIEQLRVDIVATYPHDPHAFTQGLLLRDDTLYESTGLEGRSSLRQVEVTTGKVLRQIDVPKPLFGEGLAAVNDRLFQLTWENHIALVYELASFKQIAKFSYPTEGWGLCFDGTQLIMSDGSQRLFLRDPQTFDARGVLEVTRGGRPLKRLNELECVGDLIYANIWTTDSIARIDKRSAAVTAEIDAAGLLTAAERDKADVLNGIAYDPASETFLITGKLWPHLFRVRFVPRTAMH